MKYSKIQCIVRIRRSSEESGYDYSGSAAAAAADSETSSMNGLSERQRRRIAGNLARMNQPSSMINHPMMNSWEVLTADETSDGTGVIRDRIGNREYHFEQVFESNIRTHDLYSECLRDMVMDSCNGVNCTILAYGQTASGKTHTMLGKAEEPGIMLISLSDVFTYIRKNKHKKRYTLRLSYLEIHNEVIRDLLHPKLLRLHTDTLSKTITEVSVANPRQAVLALLKGEKQRKVACTASNQRSSRSHTLLQLHIQCHPLDSGSRRKKILSSTLSLVDLAGSESISNILSADQRREAECRHINKSLLGLQRVIMRLAQKEDNETPMNRQTKRKILVPHRSKLMAMGNTDFTFDNRNHNNNNNNNSHRKHNTINHAGPGGREGGGSSSSSSSSMASSSSSSSSSSSNGADVSNNSLTSYYQNRHIPYRDSKLTLLLQNSLGGNSRTCIICNVNLDSPNREETINTLRFGQFAKKISNWSKVNETFDDKTLLHKYKNLVAKLEAQINLNQQQKDRKTLHFQRKIKQLTQDNRALIGIVAKQRGVQDQSDNSMKQNHHHHSLSLLKHKMVTIKQPSSSAMMTQPQSMINNNNPLIQDAYQMETPIRRKQSGQMTANIHDEYQQQQMIEDDPLSTPTVLNLVDDTAAAVSRSNIKMHKNKNIITKKNDHNLHSTLESSLSSSSVKNIANNMRENMMKNAETDRLNGVIENLQKQMEQLQDHIVVLNKRIERNTVVDAHTYHSIMSLRKLLDSHSQATSETRSDVSQRSEDDLPCSDSNIDSDSTTNHSSSNDSNLIPVFKLDLESPSKDANRTSGNSSSEGSNQTGRFTVVQCSPPKTIESDTHQQKVEPSASTLSVTVQHVPQLSDPGIVEEESSKSMLNVKTQWDLASFSESPDSVVESESERINDEKKQNHHHEMVQHFTQTSETIQQTTELSTEESKSNSNASKSEPPSSTGAVIDEQSVKSKTLVVEQPTSTVTAVTAVTSGDDSTKSADSSVVRAVSLSGREQWYQSQLKEEQQKSQRIVAMLSGTDMSKLSNQRWKKTKKVRVWLATSRDQQWLLHWKHRTRTNSLEISSIHSLHLRHETSEKLSSEQQRLSFSLFLDHSGDKTVCFVCRDEDDLVLWSEGLLQLMVECQGQLILSARNSPDLISEAMSSDNVESSAKISHISDQSSKKQYHTESVSTEGFQVQIVDNPVEQTPESTECFSTVDENEPSVMNEEEKQQLLVMATVPIVSESVSKEPSPSNQVTSTPTEMVSEIQVLPSDELSEILNQSEDNDDSRETIVISEMKAEGDHQTEKTESISDEQESKQTEMSVSKENEEEKEETIAVSEENGNVVTMSRRGSKTYFLKVSESKNEKHVSTEKNQIVSEHKPTQIITDFIQNALNGLSSRENSEQSRNSRDNSEEFSVSSSTLNGALGYITDTSDTRDQSPTSFIKEQSGNANEEGNNGKKRDLTVTITEQK